MITTHLETLRQRRDYLTARIAAKASVGWETTYDLAERDALAWAVAQLWALISEVGCSRPPQSTPEQVGGGSARARPSSAPAVDASEERP